MTTLPIIDSLTGSVEAVPDPADRLAPGGPFAPDAALDVVTLLDLEDQVAARARRGGTREETTALREATLRLGRLLLAPPPVDGAGVWAEAARAALDAVQADLDAERAAGNDWAAWMGTREG